MDSSGEVERRKKTPFYALDAEAKGVGIADHGPAGKGARLYDPTVTTLQFIWTF